MTIQEWRKLCAKEYTSAKTVENYDKLIKTISRCEITARKQMHNEQD